MIIKQLILSGASTKVGVFVGAYECLLENGILDSDLTGIEEIVCCSISFLFSLFFTSRSTPIYYETMLY